MNLYAIMKSDVLYKKLYLLLLLIKKGDTLYWEHDPYINRTVGTRKSLLDLNKTSIDIKTRSRLEMKNIMSTVLYPFFEEDTCDTKNNQS